jgi:hypothetical protein
VSTPNSKDLIVVGGRSGKRWPSRSAAAPNRASAQFSSFELLTQVNLLRHSTDQRGLDDEADKAKAPLHQKKRGVIAQRSRGRRSPSPRRVSDLLGLFAELLTSVWHRGQDRPTYLRLGRFEKLRRMLHLLRAAQP